MSRILKRHPNRVTAFFAFDPSLNHVTFSHVRDTGYRFIGLKYTTYRVTIICLIINKLKVFWSLFYLDIRVGDERMAVSLNPHQRWQTLTVFQILQPDLKPDNFVNVLFSKLRAFVGVQYGLFNVGY